MKSQTRVLLLAFLGLSLLPSLLEARAVVWGVTHGLGAKALRDGTDFWAGGFLVLHRQAALLFQPPAYGAFLQRALGAVLPVHVWSYPPPYLLVAAGFGWLPPWPAVLAFDAATLALLVAVLRMARLPSTLIAAVALSPASLENVLEGQNAALLTALVGGAVLLAEIRPRLAGVLAGCASIKPQLGLLLPVFLIRRAPAAVLYAALTVLGLCLAAGALFGWWIFAAFWHTTRPFMGRVLLTGRPPEFAGGLISVFAAARPYGLPAAYAAQAAATLAAMLIAARTRNAPLVLILSALACPYLHDYDLLGVTLAAALVARQRLAAGFRPGEAVILGLAWFAPGALPWLPGLAHAVPLLLILLAFAAARGDVASCPFVQASSAGPSPIPARPASTATG